MNEILQQRYDRNKNRPVAFVDESYLSPSFIVSQKMDPNQFKPFYVLTGVVVRPSEFSIIRNDLEEIVGGKVFHATDFRRNNDTSNVITDIAKYLVEGSEVALVSVRAPANDDEPGSESMDNSRKLCYRNLLQNLYQGGSNRDSVHLVVGEKRQTNRQDNWDRSIVKEAIKDGIIGRQMSLILASPSAEKLLWLPDLVSNVMYQKFSGKTDNDVSILSPCVEIIPTSK